MGKIEEKVTKGTTNTIKGEPSIWLKGYCERKWMKIKEVEKKPCKCGGQIWQVGAGRATFRICENGECASNEHWK